jgi:endonuclease-3
MSRLGPSSPPANRVRAILRRLRVAYPDARCSLDFTTPWELLVATILSAQCTDERVNMVTPGLFRQYPDPQAFADADERDIAKAIFQTGFHNQKARSLHGAAVAVLERHGGRVPRSTEQLVRLPGVGRKTAAVVSGNAFGRREGIAVDTHVGRLTRRLGLTSETDPEKVERELMGPAPGLGRVVASAHLARPRGLPVALPSLRGVRPARPLPRGSAARAAEGTLPAQRVTEAAQSPRLAWRGWIASISSSTPTASHATPRASPTSSRPRACA